MTENPESCRSFAETDCSRAHAIRLTRAEDNTQILSLLWCHTGQIHARITKPVLVYPWKNMKRRNADCGKLRRLPKRSKITEGFYGRYILHFNMAAGSTANYHMETILTDPRFLKELSTNCTLHV